MGKTRTFIGIDISDSIRTRAAALQKELAKTGAEVKWTTTPNIHITLVFLGEVDDRELPAICTAVKNVAAGEPPFTLRVSGVGAFPTPRRPKILWAGITDGTEPLQRLNAALDARMQELGEYRQEERGYTPHLTLGRVKGDADSFAVANELTRLHNWEGGSMQVEELLVFSSESSRDGPIYSIIGRARLMGMPMARPK